MKDFGIKKNWHRYALVASTIAFVGFFGITGLFYAVTAYIFLSLIKK